MKSEERENPYLWTACTANLVSSFPFKFLTNCFTPCFITNTSPLQQESGIIVLRDRFEITAFRSCWKNTMNACLWHLESSMVILHSWVAPLVPITCSTAGKRGCASSSMNGTMVVTATILVFSHDRGKCNASTAAVVEVECAFVRCIGNMLATGQVKVTSHIPCEVIGLVSGWEPW